MKRKVAYCEHTRKKFIEQGLVEVGMEENGNYVFWSNDITDVLSKKELNIFSLFDKEDVEIAEKLQVSQKSVAAYREKISNRGGRFDADAVINWAEISRLLSGDRSVVTKNRMPKKHEGSVNELRKKIREWGMSYIK